MAGANDVLMQLATYSASVTGGANPTDAATAAVTAITTVATEMSGYVNTQILGKGAKYVVIVNVPDIASTPYAATVSAAKPLIDTMVTYSKPPLQVMLMCYTWMLTQSVMTKLPIQHPMV